MRLEISRGAVARLGGFSIAFMGLAFLTVVSLSSVGLLKVFVGFAFLYTCLRTGWMLLRPPALVERSDRDRIDVRSVGGALGRMTHTSLREDQIDGVGESRPYGSHLQALGGSSTLSRLGRFLRLYVTEIRLCDGTRLHIMGSKTDVARERVSAALGLPRR